MTDDDLKTQIHELVNGLDRCDRDSVREAVFTFVARLLDERAKPVPLTPQNLNEIRSSAVSTMSNLPAPCYASGKILDGNQRVAYCYVQAVNLFLRRRNLTKYLLDIDSEQPFFYSIHED